MGLMTIYELTVLQDAYAKFIISNDDDSWLGFRPTMMMTMVIHMMATMISTMIGCHDGNHNVDQDDDYDDYQMLV